MQKDRRHLVTSLSLQDESKRTDTFKDISDSDVEDAVDEHFTLDESEVDYVLCKHSVVTCCYS